MVSEQWLRWARWGAVLLCLTTMLVAVVDQETLPGISGLIPRPVLTLLAVVYAGLLFSLLRITRGPAPARRLLALMLCSLPLDFDFLSALNLFALPFVIPPMRRRPWIWAQTVVFVIQVGFGWLGMAKPGQWANLSVVLSTDPAGLALALGAGLLQCAAWGGFAYLVGSLLVQLDTDRRLLAQTNAELRGTQTMLAETARIEERLKISRELHDSVGHYLTSLGLQMEIAGSVGGADVQRPVERARLLVRLLLAEVREAATDWRIERSEALPAAIRELCEGALGLQVKLEFAASLPPANPGTNHAIYRIVQEALTNTLRHSGARTFTVLLATPASGGFDLTVSDDGAGVAAVKPGNGLRGMEERARELNGTMQITTGPGRGFSLQVTIPGARSQTT